MSFLYTDVLVEVEKLYIYNEVLFNCTLQCRSWSQSTLYRFGSRRLDTSLFIIIQHPIWLGNSHVFSFESYPNHLTLYSYWRFATIFLTMNVWSLSVSLQTESVSIMLLGSLHTHIYDMVCNLPAQVQFRGQGPCTLEICWDTLGLYTNDDWCVGIYFRHWLADI